MFALYFAAVLLVAISLAHSLLGERYVLRRLERLDQLPRLVLGGREMMAALLRFAWHITSIAWLGFAAILVLGAHNALSNQSVAWVIAIIFGFSGSVSLVAGRGRHYSWTVFLAVGGIALFEALR